MSREILYHTAIQTEIREILNHYESISIQLADDFWDELTNAFDYACRFPARQAILKSKLPQSNTTLGIQDLELDATEQ